MIRGEAARTLVPIPSQITRIRWKIVTKPTQKLWRACINKRRRLDDITVPYGFKGEILTSSDYDLMEVLDKLMDS